MNTEKNEIIGSHSLTRISKIVTGGTAYCLNKIIKAATFRNKGSKAFVFLQNCFYLNQPLSCIKYKF